MEWLIFGLIVAALFVFDLFCCAGKDQYPSFRSSAIRVACYVAIACAFGAWVWVEHGHVKGMEFFTGYVLELSLSFDNVFVMSLIFGALGIPSHLRARVLLWGILGALVMRGVFIAAGAALVSSFSWVLLIFGAFLLYTGGKMMFAGDTDAEVDVENSKVLKFLRRFVPISQDFMGHQFFYQERRTPMGGQPSEWKTYATPLFAALVLVEVADLVFAVDSVPAVFAVTTDPFIVYTSNVFAILGLRSLFFTLEAMVNRFEYLSKALAVVLAFIGAKIILAFVHIHIPTAISLGVVVALIAGGILFSWFKTKGEAHARG